MNYPEALQRRTAEVENHRIFDAMNENQLSPDWQSLAEGIQHIIEQHRSAELVGQVVHLQAAARLEGFLDALRGMASTWVTIAKDLPPVELPPAQPTQEAGGRTPQSHYYKPLAVALKTLGGRARAADAIAKVKELMVDRLQSGDLEMVPTGPARWIVNTRFARQALREHDLMTATDPGIWELSEKGALWAESPGETLPPPVNPNQGTFPTLF